MAQPQGPLDGVKVVACSTAQAGTVPYMLMADLGAEVIKIEPRVWATVREEPDACYGPSAHYGHRQASGHQCIALELGEHNVPILTRLGYHHAQIQELKEKNVI